MIDRYASLLSAHIIAKSEQMTREPGASSSIRTWSPAPDSPYYSDQLWDWDSWWVSAFLEQVEAEIGQPDSFARYEEGCILNFLEHTSDDGYMPIQLSPKGEFRHGEFTGEEDYARNQNTHKPVIAQHAALLARRRGDAEWLRPHLPKLEAFLTGYLTRHMHDETGLAYWQTDFAIGVEHPNSSMNRSHAAWSSSNWYGYAKTGSGFSSATAQWKYPSVAGTTVRVTPRAGSASTGSTTAASSRPVPSRTITAARRTTAHGGGVLPAAETPISLSASTLETR